MKSRAGRGSLPSGSHSCSSQVCLSDADLEQIAGADRREVEPPIQVDTATWSKDGQLDWWGQSAESGSVGYGAKTVVNGGSELLIFDRPGRRDRGTKR